MNFGANNTKLSRNQFKNFLRSERFELLVSELCCTEYVISNSCDRDEGLWNSFIPIDSYLPFALF